VSLKKDKLYPSFFFLQTHNSDKQESQNNFLIPNGRKSLNLILLVSYRLLPWKPNCFWMLG
jgi:hypothetical protein